MKDRSVQYPKRYRLTKIPGTDDIYDLDPAPGEITEEGTLINKGTLLSDETAAALDLGTDAVPDDALKALLPKIGDIRVTARTDLNDTWLLCNGDQISSTDYPELSGVLSNFFEYKHFEYKEETFGTAGGSASASIAAMTCADGYWAACISRTIAVGSNSQKTISVAYATSLGGPWTIKDLTYSFNVSPTSIIHANGYWVVTGRTVTLNSSNQNQYNAAIFYATSLDGNWSHKFIWSNTNESNRVQDIAYANGYWVVCGNRYTNIYCTSIAYATSPDGIWTTKDLIDYGASYDSANCITYADGYWVVGGSYYYNSSYAYGCVWYATSPGDTWTKNSIWSGTSNANNFVKSIAYADGMWVVGGRKSGEAYIGYGPNPSGFSTKKMWFNVSNSTYEAIRAIAYADGYWVVAGTHFDSSTNAVYVQVGFSPNPGGTWGTKELWSNTNQISYIYPNDITYAADTLVICGSGFNTTLNMVLPCISYTNGINLPAISNDLYTYIKAKEG